MLPTGKNYRTIRNDNIYTVLHHYNCNVGSDDLNFYRIIKMRTTLNRLYDAGAPGYCIRGWNVLLKYVGKSKPDDAPLSMNTILDAIGLTGAIWCVRSLDDCEQQKKEFNEFLKGDRTLEEMKIKFLECFGD